MTTSHDADAFAEVIEGSYEGYDCSPSLGDAELRGIAINAPAVVSYVPGSSEPLHGGFARVIVCATYSFGFTRFDLEGDVEDSIVFVAVDEQTQARYRGTMAAYNDNAADSDEGGPDGSEGDDGEPSTPQLDPIAGYINPNLAVIMALPERDADYVVYAALQQFESNRVRISVRANGRRGA